MNEKIIQLSQLLKETSELITSIGSYVNDLSKIMLGEISKTVLSQNKEKNNERIDSGEHQLQSTGRLPVTKHNTSGTEIRGTDDVRTTTPEIFAGTQNNSISTASSEVSVITTPDRHSTSSTGTGRQTNKTDDGKTRRDGGAEGERPNVVGAENEQHQELGKRNGIDGSDLYLDHYDTELHWKNNKINHFYNDSQIQEIFNLSPHISATKSEIVYNIENLPHENRGVYFKSIFNADETILTLSNGERVGYKKYENGLYLWKDKNERKAEHVFLKWDTVGDYYNAMYLLDELKDTHFPMPTESEQINMLNKAEVKSKTSAFSLPQAFIDAYLCKGSNFTNGKMRIYEQFQKSFSHKDNVDFLRKEYGLGGSSSAIIGSGIDDDYDLKGIRLNNKNTNEKMFLSWNQVEKRISELIKLDRYLNPKEKEQYPKWLEAKEQERAEIAEKMRTKEILLNLPNEEPRKHKYKLNDKVYIGASEYEITSIDKNEVMLIDVKYPLFNKTYSIAEFDKILTMDNLNDHLKVTPVITENDDTINSLIVTSEKELIDNIPLPNIKCEWSESRVFIDGKTYSVAEFDKLMKKADDERVEGTKKAIEKYGSYDSWYEADDPEFTEFYGYDKVKFTVNMPNGQQYTERQDIGDGFGGVIEFLRQYEKYKAIVPILEEAIKKEKPTIEVRFLEQWNEYSSIKDKYSSSIILYQVGDFYEIMGKDAEIYAKLSGSTLMSKRISTEHTVAMCGIPDFKLEENVELLRTNGYSIVFASLENDKRVLRSMEAREPVPIDKDKNNVPVLSEPDNAKAISNATYQPHSNYSPSDRLTFNLAEHKIEYVGKKARFRRNIDAINILKKCETEKRLATAEEQITLSKYVGWGGIPEAFDENNSSWSNEVAELRNALENDDYVAARESSLTAFYTPPEIIESMYRVLERLGFSNGNILEPSCGIGHFIGMLPESMKQSKIYGIEIDKTSANIAQQLYQNSTIVAQGYENTKLPDSFFDVVIGNVPFGDFKVNDDKYDKYNFLIHDYFFAKSLDKLRPGGIMAFITSKGTMDKENPTVRKYIAKRADLLGAIRLPNNTFSENAGTEVVSDILILQKRDSIIDAEPDWVHLNKDENGNTMNSYFVEHPEMILGEMKTISGRFGPELSCVPFKNSNIKELLDSAISKINGHISEYDVKAEETEELKFLPAEDSVRNFSYTIVDDKIYFRENSKMYLKDTSLTAENRIKGMIKIRDSVRNLIDLQKNNYPYEQILTEQKNLNTLYDDFYKKYGSLNNRGNRLAFQDDSSYPLLSSLEILDEENNIKRKADIFSKRTIKPHIPVKSVDTADEALAVCIGEKSFIDMDYMSQLSGKTENELYQELKGAIFLNPLYEYGNHPESKYLMADEYLSGNVREKLKIAKNSAELYPEDYTINVQALEKIQPADLSASEISVRLGATWLPEDVVNQFIYEFLETSKWSQKMIKATYSKYTGEWTIENKNYDRGNIKANTTYGTSRINAYRIIENTLNLKDSKVYDYSYDADGKQHRELNKKETAIAMAKQELIKQGFKDWVWTDPQRRERLTTLYNEKFNSLRPREYDGSHIVFDNINPEITLYEHQKNAIAHIIYGGNTLLAHAVGAGKTFEMTAAAMESKRLGLCSKSMFVVPNHLIEQWASEFMQLYPSANILVSTKKDFEAKNRKRFCSRIATGDYDAVIIGHSQFEKIPISYERQVKYIEKQLNDITNGILSLKEKRGERPSVKALVKQEKKLKAKLVALNNQKRKDSVVTFEELGVDRLFVDESHYYKNLFLYTKMSNVSGVSQTEAQKSSDMFLKCQYLDEITGGRGIVFATGTPISNSMVELYTIQRYLQYHTLEKNQLEHFDAWASTFGETITAVELAPEGTGYRSKTKFAKFYNLPELMAMFKEVADIKTADMLNLPVPKANYHNVAVKPSEAQIEAVQTFADRAEKVRNRSVEPTEDNMLKITNDGRKLALDQRMINKLLPDYENSKVNTCVENVYQIWKDTSDNKSTQLIFCDLSTPKNDDSFSVYNDIRKKLIEKGIPAEEIQFVHDANSDIKKKNLFKKVREGKVRVLIGSTQKMGAGTNVQDKLIAIHDIDCPWRPSDLEQRAGRIVRQGNNNDEVHIYRYVTEQTFDAYMYQLVEGKQKFSSQIMTSKSPVRSADDIDETALSYAEIKMLATGNPYIKEKMDLDIQVQKLQLLKSNFLTEKYRLEDKIIKYYPQEIQQKKKTIENLKVDITIAEKNPKTINEEFVGAIILGMHYDKRTEVGTKIIEACSLVSNSKPLNIGTYRGFDLELYFEPFERVYNIKIKNAGAYFISVSTDAVGNVTKLDNAIDGLSKRLSKVEDVLSDLEKQYKTAQEDITKTFSQEEELKTKLNRLNELNALLNVDKKDNEIIFEDSNETSKTVQKDKHYDR